MILNKKLFIYYTLSIIINLQNKIFQNYIKNYKKTKNNKYHNK